MESENKKSAVSDVGAWAMNVISSVGIIMANKQLMSSSGYAFSFGIVIISTLSLDLIILLIFDPLNLLFCSHNPNRLPLCCNGSCRPRFKCYWSLCIKARPYVGALLVLNCCQCLHHWHEPESHA